MIPVGRGLRAQSGQILIEAMVAMTIFALVAAALVQLLGSSTSIETLAKQKTLAEQGVANQIETIRALPYGNIGTTTGNPVGTIVSPVAFSGINGENLGVLAHMTTRVTNANANVPGNPNTTADMKRVVVTITRDSATCPSPYTAAPPLCTILAQAITNIAPRQLASRTTAAVTATVEDVGNNTDPVPGIEVDLTPPSGPTLSDTTDAAGGVQFYGLAPSDPQNYTLGIPPAALPPFYIQFPTPIQFPLVATQLWPQVIQIYQPVTLNVNPINVDGTPWSGTATITITSGSGGAPLEATPYTHTFTGDGTPFTVTTFMNSDGVEQPLLPNIDYFVTFHSTGFVDQSTDAVVPQAYPATQASDLSQTFTFVMTPIVPEPTTLTTSLSATTVPAGGSVSDGSTLTGTNAASATGTVTYTVYSDAACTTVATAGTPQTITTPGTMPNSQPVVFPTVGTYYFVASYSGDVSNNPTASNCGDEVVTVGASAPTISTTLSGAGQLGQNITVPIGTAVTDQITLTGSNGAAIGTVTYATYSDAACTTQIATSTKTITTPGVIPASDPFTAAALGTYYWKGSYSGDGNNAAVTGACNEVETVGKTSPTITTNLTGDGQSGANISVRFGSPAVTDQITLVGSTGTATGTVTYKVFTNATCTTQFGATQNKTIVTPGVIPPSTAVNLTGAVGTIYYWTASYSGDANNNAVAATTCGSEKATIVKWSPTISTNLTGGSQSGANITVPSGTAVTDTITLTSSNGAATGTVTYKIYTNNTCTTQTGSTITKTITTPGVIPNSGAVTQVTRRTYYWVAAYSGDANNNAVTAACGSETEVVN